MTTVDALILGVLEGIAEFLPISSTGHLVLASHMLGLEQTAFLKSFEIAIQLGSILAVLLLFSQRFVRDRRAWGRLLVAFIPSGVAGLLLYDLIKGVLLGSQAVVVVALILVGVLLILADRFLAGHDTYSDVNELSLRQAFLIGLFQACALVPGVSRSGATIIGGLFLRLSRRAAAEFAFLLAVPTMLAATGFDLLQTGTSFSLREWGLLAVGFFAAFAVALMSVRWLLAFVSHHSFLPFGIYRILLGGVYAAVVLF